MRENLPHCTVATVVVRDNKFLLVKEYRDGRYVYNQPAGHVESGEGLLDAARRETLEETGWEVSLESCLGILAYHAPTGTSYIRTTFVATPLIHHEAQPLDDGIESADWHTLEQIVAMGDSLRSPVVLKVIEDYLAGRVYPLAMIQEHR